MAQPHKGPDLDPDEDAFDPAVLEDLVVRWEEAATRNDFETCHALAPAIHWMAEMIDVEDLVRTAGVATRRFFRGSIGSGTLAREIEPIGC